MHFKDYFNILSSFTIKRLYNLIHLSLSYLLAKYFKLIVPTKYPYSLTIEPTTACNLSCPECPSGLKSFTRETGTINVSFFKDKLKEFTDYIGYINFYFQGEPFIHKNFLELITAAKEHKIYCSTSTNAHFITTELAEGIVNSGLDRLTVSIDGTTQETYENYRVGGSLEKALTGLKEVVKAKQRVKSARPFIIFQFLVVKANECEIKEALSLSKQIGADTIRFKTAQVYDYKNGNSLIPENLKYSRYIKNKDNTYSIKNKLLNHCWRMWSASVITWDGIVVPCCFDKDATHQIGNINNKRFSEVWNSLPYKRFREKVFRNREKIPICINCTEGSKVWG